MAQVTIQERLAREADAAAPKSAAATPLARHEKPALPVPPTATYDATPRPGGNGARAIVLWSILIGVVLPFILACIYYGAVATPQFLAEARFAVRTLGGASVTGAELAGGNRLLATTPLQQDAYIVTSFIHSPAILDRLSDDVDFTALFGGDGIDYWSRLGEDHTHEDLADYWNDQVTTYLDGPSGIVTLRVRAFSPEDARTIAQAVIDESELLANELSARARSDYVRRAEQEVSGRQADYQRVLERLNALQNETAILDPTQRASETGTLLANLLAQKLDVDARLFVLEQQATTDSPAVRQLRRSQEALAGQIGDLRARLADSGTVDENLSNSLRRFAELETERMLASELYAAAHRNLAQAQADAIRKAVYITVFVPPDLAEESRYPRRIAMPLLILLGLSVAWGVCALAWASIEDHKT